MSGVWICPRQHTWRTQPADAEATLDVCQECPICGAAGSWHSDAGTAIDAEAAFAAPRPAAVPGYEIFEEIGRGAMGVVYRARDLQLNRTVALKMILSGAHAAPTDRARFRREVESVAALQHPNILQIHAVGEVDGLPYCALEYVAGGTLSKRLKQGPLPPSIAARLISALARATHYAHENGIIHRDLKPGNVLIRSSKDSPDDKGSSLTSSPGGELFAKIADFGLAKRLDADLSLTGSSAVLGTPSNMAPEQADGRNRTITPAADVYGLGTILYECLAGRAVFKANSPLETLHQVINSDPPPLRSLDPKIPRDLETVCLKCLRKDPTQRYASASELADDLDRFLAGEPVRARATGWVERTWRHARKQNALLLTLALAVTLVLGVVALERLQWLGRKGTPPEAGDGQTQVAPTKPTIVVRAATAGGELRGYGFLTSDRGVIQVSTDVLGISDESSERPSAIQITIKNELGQESFHEADIALVEPRFKLALLRLRGSDAPEPVKPDEPVERSPESAAPAVLSKAMLERFKQGPMVALRWKGPDEQRGAAVGCVIDNAGTIITMFPALGMNEVVMRPPDRIMAVAKSGTPKEITAPAQLLACDRSTGLAILQARFKDPVEPAALGSSDSLTEGQPLWVVAFALHNASADWEHMMVGVRIRSSRVAGRVAMRSGGVRYLQLDGAYENGIVIDGSGRMVGLTLSAVPGSQLSFATPVEMAKALIRGRVTEITPGQAYETAQGAELPVEVRLADPLRAVGKVSLDIWTGRRGSGIRPARDTRPAPVEHDGEIVTTGLGAVADPDRIPGDARRYSGLIELPPKKIDDVYWVRPRYVAADGKERWDQAVIMNISAPVRRLAANLAPPKFVPGESDVSMIFVDRRLNAGKLMTLTAQHGYHETWQRREDYGDEVDIRCTRAEYDAATIRSASFKDVLATVRGLQAKVKFTDRAVAVEQINAANVPVVLRPYVYLITQSTLDSVYGFRLQAPATDLRPDDTWNAELTLPTHIGSTAERDPATHAVRFQYLGRRSFLDREEAVVAWTGRSLPNAAVPGSSRGSVVIDLETGRARLAHRIMESDLRTGPYAPIQDAKSAVMVSLDLMIRRSFGPLSVSPPQAGDEPPGQTITLIPFVGAKAP